MTPRNGVCATCGNAAAPDGKPCRGCDLKARPKPYNTQTAHAAALALMVITLLAAGTLAASGAHHSALTAMICNAYTAKSYSEFRQAKWQKQRRSRDDAQDWAYVTAAVTAGHVIAQIF